MQLILCSILGFANWLPICWFISTIVYHLEKINLEYAPKVINQANYS